MYVPGLSPQIQQMLGVLSSLSSKKPSSPEEANAISGFRQRLLQEMQNKSEYSLRDPGDPAPDDGFTGRIGNPAPVRAPWRGDYDMPGNFERSQTMANSQANDAALRSAMSYGYKVGDGGVPVDFANTSMAYLANSLDSSDQEQRVVLSGPPDMKRMMRFKTDPTRWDPSGERVGTEGDIRMQLARGKMALRQGGKAATNWMKSARRALGNQAFRRMMAMIGG